MILTEVEIQEAIKQAKAAFPSFSEWEYNNEVNDSYCGFSLWGELAIKDNDSITQYFFVTLDSYKDKWCGHLSIGKPCYFWSSADVGDANLLDTQPCKALEDALLALKGEIAALFKILLP
ncbi:MAG: hypothetical protein FD167_3216 [bacterium]|nr:MAG: hypothetical protein FD167_3216 [bacterium]